MDNEFAQDDVSPRNVDKNKKGRKKSSSISFKPLSQKQSTYAMNIAQREKAMNARSNKNYKVIEKDLRERQKRQEREGKGKDKDKGPQDMYIDKDRAIAALGGDDLKGNILKHRGKMGTNSAALTEYDLGILIQQAEYELKGGNSESALAYLEKAMTIKNDNIECLVLKATCLINLNRFREALHDVDRILNELREPKNSRALSIRGDALYNLGNFEHSLLNYHRAKKNAKIKEKSDISKSILRCEMAIENSIGPQAGNFFKKVEKIICKIPTSFMGLEWDKLKTQLEKHTRESKARDRKFLGDLASDKFYLEDVLDKLGEHTILNNSHGCENVRGKIGDTLVYLNERREFWSTQNPNYGDMPETEIGGSENENVEITNGNVDAQRGRI